jgi:hypothetical protein
MRKGRPRLRLLSHVRRNNDKHLRHKRKLRLLQGLQVTGNGYTRLHARQMSCLYSSNDCLSPVKNDFERRLYVERRPYVERRLYVAKRPYVERRLCVARRLYVASTRNNWEIICGSNAFSRSQSTRRNSGSKWREIV